MKKLISVLSVFVFVFAVCMNANAQLANAYIYSTSEGATLEDMTTGATVLQTAPNDDAPSLLTTFPGGFTFTYEGTPYTEFSTTPDGFLKLGSPVAVAQFTNAITSTTNRPKIFPYWDDLALGSAAGGGNVSYKLVGTTPNQKFVIQWFCTVPRSTTGPANTTFQVWLHESGRIDLVYGTSGGNTASSSVGINSVAANATNFQSVTISTNTNSTSTANNSNAAWPGSGRMYSYELPPACNMGITNILPAGTIAPGCNSLTVAPKVNIINNGLSGAQTGITVTYAVPSESYSETVGAPDLAVGANTDVVFPATLVLDPNNPGTKAVTVTVNSTCNAGAQVYTLNTSYDVSSANVNFGGPSFGYYFANSTTGGSCAPNQPICYMEDTTGSTSLIVNGADVSGGLLTGSVDDGFFRLGLAGVLGGQVFRYDNVDYDSFFVGTNGMVAFTRANNTQAQLTTFTPLAIPSLTAPRPAIFPFWKDFQFNSLVQSATNRLSYKIANGKLIITYSNAPNFASPAVAGDYTTFQVILELGTAPTDNGTVIAQYDETQTGLPFLIKYNDGTLPTNTVGIQNTAGTTAIQYRRGTPPTVTGGPLYVNGGCMALAFGPNNNVLPVELASFTSSVNKNDVTLNWTTSSESNNAGFDIERSTNGVWSKVGFVNGNGTSTATHSYSYMDRNVASGSHSYRLKQIDFNGNFAYHNLNGEISVGVPTKYDLSQNYPNPFNPSTSINYEIPFDGKVSLKIFDMSGKEVATLVNEVKTAGYYTYNFNASNLSSGVYFYSLSANNFTATKKMMLLK